MPDMANHPTTGKMAVIYRMALPHHTCPYGLKAKALLKRSGYAVEDHHLTTREETAPVGTRKLRVCMDPGSRISPSSFRKASARTL